MVTVDSLNLNGQPVNSVLEHKMLDFLI